MYVFRSVFFVVSFSAIIVFSGCRAVLSSNSVKHDNIVTEKQSIENQSEVKSTDTINVAKVSQNKIELNGELSDWNGIEFISVTPFSGVFDRTYDVTDSMSDLSFAFAVCQDADGLYIAVKVRDDKVCTDSTKPGETHARAWEDDAIEIFIDGNHNHAENSRDAQRAEYMFGGEFSLVINGAATSSCSGWPDTFGTIWRGATNYTEVVESGGLLCYEVYLPWQVMGGEKREDVIGFTICFQDDDDGGGTDHALYWQGISPYCWKNEGGWGNLILE